MTFSPAMPKAVSPYPRDHDSRADAPSHPPRARGAVQGASSGRTFPPRSWHAATSAFARPILTDRRVGAERSRLTRRINAVLMRSGGTPRCARLPRTRQPPPHRPGRQRVQRLPPPLRWAVLVASALVGQVRGFRWPAASEALLVARPAKYGQLDTRLPILSLRSRSTLPLKSGDALSGLSL